MTKKLKVWQLVLGVVAVFALLGILAPSEDSADDDPTEASRAVSASVAATSTAAATSSAATTQKDDSFESRLFSVVEFQIERNVGRELNAEGKGALFAYKLNLALYKGEESPRYEAYYYALNGRGSFIQEFGDTLVDEVRDYITAACVSQKSKYTADDLDMAEQLRIEAEIRVADEQAQLDAEAKADYIAKAETVKYDSLVREPYNYEGSALKVTVTIEQVMPGGLFTESGYRCYVSGTKKEWYVHYDLPENTPRILEGDKVTFYGEFAGLETMTRSLTNTKEQIPKLNALYHD